MGKFPITRFLQQAILVTYGRAHARDGVEHGEGRLRDGVDRVDVAGGGVTEEVLKALRPVELKGEAKQAILVLLGLRGDEVPDGEGGALQSVELSAKLDALGLGVT